MEASPPGDSVIFNLCAQVEDDRILQFVIQGLFIRFIGYIIGSGCDSGSFFLVIRFGM